MLVQEKTRGGRSALIWRQPMTYWLEKDGEESLIPTVLVCYKQTNKMFLCFTVLSLANDFSIDFKSKLLHLDFLTNFIK